ncbi:MAG: tight adherence protein [Microbacteriaceae bacterium]|jgi:tight adherence protein B|nr:tight adherence protein [Microbacteriaceae bacterium]
MSIVLGCLLGAGLLLAASPFFWPRTRADTDAGRRPGALERLRVRLALAGFGTLPPAAFLTACVLLGVAAAALAGAALGVAALAIAAGLVGAILPLAIVSVRARARRRANRAVWPGVVDHLVSAVRSGLALPDSVSSLAQTGPTETRDAFADFAREYRASGNFTSCVDRLKDRLADPAADRILETLRMAREVGGTDLTLVLRSLATFLREETTIRAEVEARQSWVTNAARLGVAAPWIVLVLLASRPEAALAYNSPTGSTVIVLGLAVSVVAYQIMLALGRLPEEERWFQ